MSNQGKYAVLILAAGSSSRLGEPKQLLSYGNKNLLNHTIDEAKKAGDGIVVVILGGNYHLIAGNIHHAGIKVSYNAAWEKGMSSSIVKGLQELTREHAGLEGVILTVCDQPFISAALFNELIAAAVQTGKTIVASAYAGTLGTPVLFLKKHFDSLLNLKGKEGGRGLIEKYKEDVASVIFENGEIDIDTMDDYNDLISNK